jgi:hypothetical protein
VVMRRAKLYYLRKLRGKAARIKKNILLSELKAPVRIGARICDWLQNRQLHTFLRREHMDTREDDKSDPGCWRSMHFIEVTSILQALMRRVAGSGPCGCGGNFP